MRFPLIISLTIVVSTVAGSAQTHHKQAVKPYHEEKSKSGAVPMPVQRDSGSQQLRKIEQDAVKSMNVRKQSPRSQRLAPVKVEHERANAPINFSSAASGKASGATQGKNPYMGRLKEKTH